MPQPLNIHVCSAQNCLTKCVISLQQKQYPKNISRRIVAKKLTNNFPWIFFPNYDYFKSYFQKSYRCRQPLSRRCRAGHEWVKRAAAALGESNLPLIISNPTLRCSPEMEGKKPAGFVRCRVPENCTSTCWRVLEMHLHMLKIYGEGDNLRQQYWLLQPPLRASFSQPAVADQKIHMYEKLF